MSGAIAEQFPNVAAWIEDGWIELGPTNWSRSFIRLMIADNLMWEGREHYASVERAFADAEAAIEAGW